MTEYKAPTSGFYEVSATVFYSEPTGRIVERENYARRWFQFWKPKLVMAPEYRVVERKEGREIKFLKKGDTVEATATFIQPPTGAL